MPSARTRSLVSPHWPAPRRSLDLVTASSPRGPLPHTSPLSAPATLLTPASLSSTCISQPSPVMLEQGRTWPEPAGPERSPGPHTAASAGLSQSRPCAHGLLGDPATFFPPSLLPGLTHQRPVWGGRGRVSLPRLACPSKPRPRLLPEVGMQQSRGTGKSGLASGPQSYLLKRTRCSSQANGERTAHHMGGGLHPWSVPQAQGTGVSSVENVKWCRRGAGWPSRPRAGLLTRPPGCEAASSWSSQRSPPREPHGCPPPAWGGQWCGAGNGKHPRWLNQRRAFSEGYEEACRGDGKAVKSVAKG